MDKPSTDAKAAQTIQGLEAELKRSRQAVAALEEELARTREELSQSIHARDDFIAIAAHELRNPMGAISLYVQNLLLSAEREQGACSEDIRSDLLRLDLRVQRFIKRAAVLLDVTRLAAGNFPLELETVDLSALTRAVLADFETELKLAECPLSADLQNGVTGTWDPLGLEQVLTNLVSNALKYGAGRPIRVCLSADRGMARLEVHDSGIGISAEAQARIFGKFERAVHRSTHGGFGVGLWIIRQLIVAMGGEIVVESRPGRGSSFAVSLPRRPAHQEGVRT